MLCITFQRFQVKIFRFLAGPFTNFSKIRLRRLPFFANLCHLIHNRYPITDRCLSFDTRLCEYIVYRYYLVDDSIINFPKVESSFVKLGQQPRIKVRWKWKLRFSRLFRRLETEQLAFAGLLIENISLANEQIVEKKTVSGEKMEERDDRGGRGGEEKESTTDSVYTHSEKREWSSDAVCISVSHQ